MIWLDEIVNKTIDYLDLSKEILKISMSRRVIILLARNYTEESNISISKEIGVTKSLVSKVNIDLVKIDEKKMSLTEK